MSETTVAEPQTVSALVGAAETLFATLSGKALNANVLKVSSGTTFVVDGLLPTLASRVTFDLDGVFAGATQVLQGLNTAIAAAKARPAAATAVTGASTVAAVSSAA